VAGLVAQLRRGNRGATALVVAGVLGAGVALLGALVPDLARWLVTALPGGGLLRDAHKLLAPWVLAVAVGIGGAVVVLLGRAGRRPAGFGELAKPAAVLLAAGVLLALPSLATGLGGRLEPVAYPADYAATAAALERRSGADDLAVVLPWQPYRAYSWVDGRTVLDPLPRWLPTTTVTDDDLAVGARSVSGEGPLADRLDPALSSPGPLAPRLARHDVRWVLVERRTGSTPVPGRALTGLVPVRVGRHLELLRVPGVPAGRGERVAAPVRPPLGPVLAADVAAALLVAVAAGTLLLPFSRFQD
jgi:hypothetical protein